MIKKILISAIFVFSAPLILAAAGVDSDADGLFDEDELKIYYTSWDKADSDGDGYNDREEIANGYSPHRAGDWMMYQLDWDKDGLNDALELKFGTDMKNPDSDADGYLDGDEVLKAYNPLSQESLKLPKKIEINLAEQKLSYLVNNILVGSFPISAGLPGWNTPKGTFRIYNKIDNAWSNMAGLWMPYWMAFTPTGRFGIHELPVWPGGYREGEDHLGKPASHGCVRLGVGPAESLYNWADIGTPVVIY